MSSSKPEPRLKTQMPASGLLCARDASGTPLAETGREIDKGLKGDVEKQVAAAKAAKARQAEAAARDAESNATAEQSADSTPVKPAKGKG